jgi:hypothetical protein
MERAKRQVRLRRHPTKAEYAHSKCLSAIPRKLEQRGFSDARFATDDQCGAAAVTDKVNQPVNKGNIVLAPIENV